MSESALAELLNLTGSHYKAGRFFIPFLAMGGWLIGLTICLTNQAFLSIVIGLTIGAGTQVLAIAFRALLDIADTIQDKRQDDLLAKRNADTLNPGG